MTATEQVPTAKVRTDIQGLRAIAVSLVLGYHLVPKELTGGFTGVDVFFVISGFLITLHLLERLPQRPSDLVWFWSRRIRRLLPAALLVLATTLIASRILAPETQWANTARQSRAAAFYVLNWLLARDAVDYLAAENAASPVQHYWSLAVEEQFYLVWPIAILLLGLLARKIRQDPIRVVLVGIVLVVIGSLAYSIHLTATEPAAAYFVSPTRIWELGIGGALAAITLLRPGQLPARYAVPLAWAGLAAIGWTAATYSETTAFPGWRALVPVLGTAAVIAAQSDRGFGSPARLLALAPVQWIGNISYSVYLWHWPLVVWFPQITGHPLTWTDRGSILMATLALGGFTKVLLEDRFRVEKWALPAVKPFALAAVAMVLVTAGAAVQLNEVSDRTDSTRAAVALDLVGSKPCLGARALDAGADCPAVAYDDLVPGPIAAASDRSDAYDEHDGNNCLANQPAFELSVCTFAPPKATTQATTQGATKKAVRNVVLIGNSHAAQWLPTLQRIGKRVGFKVTTVLASRCALSDIRQSFGTSADYPGNCLSWVHRARQKVIDLDPDLVVMTNRISTSSEAHRGDVDASVADYAAGYTAVLKAWKKADIPVLVLRDTPAPGVQIPDCIAINSSAPERCDGTRETWLPSAPEKDVVAALDTPTIGYADLTDHICAPVVCSAVVGGVIGYFDSSHMTATFATTLAPYLGEPVRRMLRASTQG